MKICEIEKCTGCFACMNICEHKAIQITYDKMGKSIPIIDENRCIKCNLCETICPQNRSKRLVEPKKIFAAWSKNKTDQIDSASGGVATVFSRNIIENKGIVCGAVCENKETTHMCADSLQQIEKMRGSKYVQSNIDYVYKEIKEHLLSLKNVLFIGTPCQVAGLKAYLNKEYKKLITVDLICHGVPPQAYITEHLNALLKNKWDRYSFRGKYDYKLTVYYNDQIVYSRYPEHEKYFFPFMKGMIVRDNCYNCEYACKKRIADITIGDFWGIKHSSLTRSYNGRISLVMLNTDKGEDFWENVKDNFVFEERTFLEAANELQTNLREPSPKHIERSIFEQLYPIYGYEKSISKTKLGKNIGKLYLKYKIYTLLKHSR